MDTRELLDLVLIYLGCCLIVKTVFFMNHRDDYLMQMIQNSDVAWLAG